MRTQLYHTLLVATMRNRGWSGRRRTVNWNSRTTRSRRVQCTKCLCVYDDEHFSACPFC